MSRRRPAKSSPGRLATALLALLAGGWLCVHNLIGGAPPVVADDDQDPDAAAGSLDDDPVDGSSSPVDDVGDLLAVVGSFDPSVGVSQVFASHDDLAQPAPAAPGGETGAPAPPAAGQIDPNRGGGPEPAPPADARWTGPAPPALRVTFTMVGGDVARACVDGVVVGVGDEVAAGTVVEIRRDGIRVRAQSRGLFYELDDGVPREYRAEARRRAAVTQNEQEESK